MKLPEKAKDLTLLESLAGLTQHLVTDYKQVVKLLEEGIAKRYFPQQTSSICF